MDDTATNSSASYFPAELAGQTVESLYALHGPEKRWTYWLILIACFAALGSLPLIQVDVTVRAPGLVRPRTELTELKTLVSARISEVLAKDNDIVQAGQVLVRLSAGDLDERIRRQTAARAEKVAVMADLQRLLEQGEQAQSLVVAALRQEQTQFQAQLDAYRLAEAKAAGDLARFAALADKGIATRQELDNARYEVERLRAEARLFREQSGARWATRLRDEQVACDDLASELRRLEQERSLFEIHAPAHGTLMGFVGWSPDAQVSAGQTLGMVSPVDRVRVESQVSSRDIGLVRPGQHVRLQVDAYPYTQWGMVDGVVESIGGDLQSGAQDSPGYFKVLIRPLATHLSLPNGLRGELKKGLTLAVRYVVARRSLLQVLCDDASAWLNPQDNHPSSPTGHP